MLKVIKGGKVDMYIPSTVLPEMQKICSTW